MRGTKGKVPIGRLAAARSRAAAFCCLLLAGIAAAQAPSAGFQQDAATGLLSIDVEHFDGNVSQGGHSWSPVSPAGASGGAALQALPNSGTNNNTGYVTNSPRLDFVVNFTQVGTHYVWLRGQGATNADDSAHVGLNGAAQATADRISGFGTGWTWTNATMDGVRATIEVTAPGEQTLNIWMREDGLVVDKIVLTTDAALQPSSFGAEGPPESPQGAPQPGLQFDTATVTLAADEGDTVAVTQLVSLDTSDTGVVVYTLASSAPSWLSASPVTGSTPATGIEISADPTGLAAGQYTGTITASATGYADASVDVTLNVQAALFVVSDFNDGNVSNWTTVEASGDVANWQVVNGRFSQLNPASSTAARADGYLVGTYAFLNTQTNVGDFEFSVEITPQATAFPRFGDDVGIIFRYVNDNNYYRLSINSKFGQTRLERRIAGQFSTIAVTSQGYLPDQTIRVGVRMQGPAMLLYRDYGGGSSVLDGEPYLAGYDSTLAAGSVGLYTQSEAAFDNVLLKSLHPAPRVGLISPAPFEVDGDAVVDVQAVTINASGSEAVGFELDGVPCNAVTTPQPALYESTCVAAIAGEHNVDAVLNDPTEVDRDTAPAVATGGLRAVTMGNSITSGTKDEYWADNIGADIEVGGVPAGPRQVGFRGFQTVMHDQLGRDLAFGRSNVVFNEGIPGDTTDELVYGRLPSIIERQDGASIAYVMIGTNDANSNSPKASGLGCSGATCNNTYKGALLDLVDGLDASGIETVLAKIPPIFGQGTTTYADPLSASTRNNTVLEYNAAIDEVLAERSLRPGPDFFAEFLTGGENRYTLFGDFLHPNSLGYVWMANAWKQFEAPDGTVPFVLHGLCVRRTSSACVSPNPYKQNYRQAGDSYYTDRTYTLTSVPAILDGGVWIVTANDDKSNTRNDYLEFSIDRDVDVYVAFTPTATSLPNWLATFAATGAIVGVSAGTPALNLYQKFYASGSVITLGGNVAAGIAGGGNNNFVVIVVPR